MGRRKWGRGSVHVSVMCVGGTGEGGGGVLVTSLREQKRGK